MIRKLLFTVATATLALVVLSGPTASAQDAVVVQGPSVETPAAPDSGVLRRSASAGDVELLGVFGGLAVLALTLSAVLQRRWTLAQVAGEAHRQAEAPGRPQEAPATALLVPGTSLSAGTALHASADRSATASESLRR